MASSAQETSHGIRLVSRWNFLRGCAYGIGQPVALGRLAVTLPPGTDLAALDAFMATSVEEPHSLSTEPEDLAHAVAERLMFWVLTLQRQQRIPVFGRPHLIPADRDTAAEGRGFIAAVATHSAQATVESFKWARSAVNLVLNEPQPSADSLAQVRAQFEELQVALQKLSPTGINNFHLIDAAHAMGIPTRMVYRDIYSFGHGAGARWFNSTMTDRTPLIGAGVARLKSVAARIMAQHGVPVPRHRFAASEDEAAEIARELGLPVVVKPDDQDQGRGVEAGLQDEQAVRKAWNAAMKFSPNVLV
jgi:cyanophycin synthetase